MCRMLSFVGVAVVLTTVAPVSEAETITFDEPAVVSILGSSIPQLNVGGVTFTPEGVPWGSVPLVTPRTTFDDRPPSPYPYDFISGHLLQVHSTELRVDLSQPVSSFGFGAALDSTASPGQMRIYLFDSGLGSLGTFFLTLDRTLVSQLGGTNSNSEGQFIVGGLAGMSRARITNFGGGTIDESEFNFVVDNVTFQPIPEPPTLLLLAMAGTFLISRRLSALKKRGFHSPLGRRSVLGFGFATLLAAATLGALQPAFSSPPLAEPADKPPETEFHPAVVSAEDGSGHTAEAGTDFTEKQDDRLAQIIEQVRANEDRYRNLETLINRTTRIAERDNPDKSLKTTIEETHHTVVQGNLIRFEGEEVCTRPTGEKVRRRRHSSYDGEKTVSVEYGNSVNIHLGRYEASQVSPPHTWAIAHWDVNFPLSVLLEGTRAMQQDPKVRRLAREHGSGFEFNKVECDFEEEEMVNGLRCLKIRCRRWHYSSDPPVIWDIWLAPERNYLCLKSQSLDRKGEVVVSESRVDELRQVAPGVWFPVRVTMENYAGPSDAKPYVWRRLTLAVEKVLMNPGRPASFFHDIEIPDELPVFTMRDGSLENSLLEKPAIGDRASARFKEILEHVRANENRYEDLETRVRETYRDLAEPEFGPRSTTTVAIDATQRSVIQGAQGYCSEEETSRNARGTSRRRTTVRAYDGEWTRSLIERTNEGSEESSSRYEAVLRKGRERYLAVFRPHTTVFRSVDDYRPASEILTSGTGAGLDLQQNHPSQDVEYLGTQIRNDLECEVLRLASVFPNQAKPSYVRLLWLAKDRNYLPIRREEYKLSRHARLPQSVTVVDDLRQIADGLWFPFHTVVHRFESINRTGHAEGRLILRWRKEHTVEGAALNPSISADLFAGSAVPEGTKVIVLDESGDRIGSYDQRATSNTSVTPEEWAAMKAHAADPGSADAMPGTGSIRGRVVDSPVQSVGGCKRPRRHHASPTPGRGRSARQQGFRDRVGRSTRRIGGRSRRCR